MNSGFIILIVLVLFLVWLFMVRPHRRRQMAQQAMIDDLRVGDEVLTAGGFFATVRGISEDEVTVELGPGTEARLSKRAIAVVLPPEDEDGLGDRTSPVPEPEPMPPEPAEETRR